MTNDREAGAIEIGEHLKVRMRGRPAIRVARLLAAAALAVLASCGRAQWREADASLNGAAAAARAAGFEPLNGPHNTFGTFSDSGQSTWRVHLSPHQTYFLAGGCSTGCESLDFTITDSNHDESFADTTAGPTPRLMFMPLEGNLRVTFRHGRCAAGRCRWVAQVYARPSASR